MKLIGPRSMTDEKVEDQCKIWEDQENFLIMFKILKVVENAFSVQ